MIKNTLISIVAGFFFCCCIISCERTKTTKETKQSLYQLVPKTKSKVDFKNKLTETDSLNYFNYGYIYMGGGVSIGDINNDGLDDIFFTSNMVKNRLYLNKGNLEFEDITETSNISGTRPWDNDIAHEDLDVLLFDADNDGDQDLYVVSGGNEWKKDHSNYQDRLYLNNGQGDFTKSVHSLPSFYTSGSRVKAYDYNNDGDLDLFVGGCLVPQQYPLPANSHILRNEGVQNGIPKFVDVTKKIAPILNESRNGYRCYLD